LQPIRTPSSEQLDNRQIVRRGGETVVIPAFQQWTSVYRMLERQWHVGQHVALLSRSGSGKTTLAREILDIRDRVIVFGTKPDDAELYPAFQRKGYAIVDRWGDRDAAPDSRSPRRVIFRPPGGFRDRKSKAQAFGEALDVIDSRGSWTIYVDEMLVLTRDLGMGDDINSFYTQARSNHVTMVAGTQRPRGAPLNMFEQSIWSFVWRIADLADRERASEFLGPNRWMAFEATRALPPYEFVLVNTSTDYATRSKVGT
jgi:hypothetical protein